MKKFLKICGLVLLFAIWVEFSPIIILVLMIAFICGKGDTAKEKANALIDKTKRIINC